MSSLNSYQAPSECPLLLGTGSGSRRHVSSRSVCLAWRSCLSLWVLPPTETRIKLPEGRACLGHRQRRGRLCFLCLLSRCWAAGWHRPGLEVQERGQRVESRDGSETGTGRAPGRRPGRFRCSPGGPAAGSAAAAASLASVTSVTGEGFLATCCLLSSLLGSGGGCACLCRAHVLVREGQ